jgi:hypothetical protein
MADFYLALALMLAISLAATWLGLRFGRGAGPRVGAAAALLTCVFTVCFALFVRDELALTRVIPSSAAIVYCNPLPPAVGLLCGLAWRRIPGRVWRKAMLLLPFALLCLYQSYGFLLGAPPPLDNRWKNGVCRQTSLASCSPAAAATLLRACGIEATEAEMADLCLTRPAGTAMLGLYRGLKLKTSGTGLAVEAFSGDIEALRAEPGPVILSVRLDRRPGIDSRYEQVWGWAPGVSHTVVFFGFRPDGKVDVGDPAVGREAWRVQDLQVLWHGKGLRIAGRPAIRR